MNDALRSQVAAFEQTVRSSLAVAATLDAADWDRPTECPGWTVKDQIAHMLGVERTLLGDPLPADPLPEDVPHVRNEFGRLMELLIEVRRPLPGPVLARKLEQTLDQRLAELATIDPERQIMCPDFKMGNYIRFMTFRAMDCWTHEQDIRRAVGQTGNLDAPAALSFWTILGNGLQTAVLRAAAGARGLGPVFFAILGPPSFERWVTTGDDGAPHIGAEPAGRPTTSIEMSWETYVRLAAGRCGPAAVTTRTSGDRALADRVLANMALTP